MPYEGDRLVAGLLEEFCGETDFTLDELRQQFGDAVANIVDGVTKFDSLAGHPIVPTDEIRAKEVTRAQTIPLSLSMNSGAPSTSEQFEQKQRHLRDLKRRQR